MANVRAKLVAKRPLSHDTSDFEFEILDNALKGLEPGCHVDVHLGPDPIRQYSLWNWAPDGSFIQLGVRREDIGRGGSLTMHALEVGAFVQISTPRNNFQLHDRDGHITLVAGGIGATPILAMARQLASEGRSFQVFYLVRSESYSALHREFEEIVPRGAFVWHRDDVDGRMDLGDLFTLLPANSDVYACGPSPMSDAVMDAGSALTGGKVYLERFSALPLEDLSETRAFEVVVTHGPERPAWRFTADNREIKVPIDPCLTSNNGDLIAQMCLFSEGIALLPGFIVADLLAEGRFEQVLPNVKPPDIWLAAAFPPYEKLPAKVEAFVAFAQGALNEKTLFAGKSDT